ncbi:MAG: hypothetical protein CL932_14080 [Deltaproteobacteria bacterium]|nr:hypothetical protein [Deltaproteobacteria bacterium]
MLCVLESAQTSTKCFGLIRKSSFELCWIDFDSKKAKRVVGGASGRALLCKLKSLKSKIFGGRKQ